ncbi:hypothetical protein V1508DRAFT_421267 [Lipomyces doorenjongii]|uniref:uncharacterized protein n=1 Tax=Lipomyces doorenjongii TaxID=383834 RepID=UPI0034CDFBF1
MNALSVVFPTALNQLCRWHIEQNILKNCRKYFNNVADFDKFMKVIQAIGGTEGSESQTNSFGRARLCGRASALLCESVVGKWPVRTLGRNAYSKLPELRNKHHIPS